MLEVLYHHARFGGARISPAAGVAKNVEFFLLPAALRAAQICRYLVYSEAGATCCTDGGEIFGDRCNDKGVGPPKWKF